MRNLQFKGDIFSLNLVRCAVMLAALFFTQQINAQTLINIDFGAGLTKSAKVGPAATGQSAQDFWNFYSRDDGDGGWLTFGVLSSLSQADGTTTSVGLTVDNAPGAWGNGSSDPMYNAYIYPFGGNATITATNLPPGQYDLYVYSQDGNYDVTVGTVDYGVQTTHDVPVTSPPVWGQGVQYALFQGVAVTTAGDPVVLTVRPGVYGYAIIAGLQIATSSGSSAPRILVPPRDQAAAVGNNVTFTVTATGTPPLSFQWQKGDAPLQGETNVSLTLHNVQLADTGTYSVQVTNAFGSVTSSNATLNVLQASTNFLINLDFGAGLTHSAKTGAAAIGTGGDFWNYYSRDDGHGGWLTFGAVSSLSMANQVGTAVGVTVANAPGAWGNGSSDPMYGAYIYPFGGNATITVTNLPVGQYDVYVYSQDGNYQLLVGADDYGVQTCRDVTVANPPAWQQGVQYTLFQSAAVTSPGQPLVVNVRPGQGGYAIIAGMQITASSSAAPQVPPTIVSQPASQSVTIGSDATFTVLARGSGPFSYQWFFYSNVVDGATSYAFTVNNAQTNDSGPYSVIVSNAYGMVTSAVANLTVSQLAPAILSQPQDQIVLAGSNATFSVSATGAAPLGYQWLFNGAPFYGAGYFGTNGFGGPNLIIPNAQPANAGSYSVRVFNAYGAVTSSVATLTVSGFVPTIVQDPGSETATNGDTVSFSVGANGSVPLFYQWLFNGTAIYGATLSTLTLNNVQTNQAGAYSVVVSNWVGQVTSASANLTVLQVNHPPVANSQNVITTLNKPVNITLSGSDRDNDPLTYIVVTQPANGTLAGTAPSLAYQPNTNFSGADSFTFKVNDGQADSAVVTVNITVLSNTAAMLIDVDFGAGLTKSPETGPAAVGLTANDFWNFYSRDDGNGGWLSFGVLTNLALVDGTATSVGLTVDNAPGAWGGGSSDPMYDSYIYPFSGNATITVTNLPAGLYDFYIYSADGNYQVTVDSVDYGVQTTYDLPVSNPPVWRQGMQYALFQGIAVTKAGQAVALTVRPGTAGYAIISGMQIVSSSMGGGPVILQFPQDQTASVGDIVTFNVRATGSPPLSYQWDFNGSPISGQTGASLILTNVQKSQAGIYSVVVSNSFGSVLSSNATLAVNFPPAEILIGSNSVAAGGVVTFPIMIVANGNENALGFSLNFSPALLTYANISLGSGAAGATLIANANQVTSGVLGVLLALPPDTTLAPGTQELAEVTFTAAAVAGGANAQLAFGDQPTRRELSDVQANPLLASYGSGSVSIAPADFEGDLTPRPNGDKVVSVTDWVLAGRYAAKLDSPTNSGEFQRADCAPRNTLGDGAITVADWVQVGRYAAGLDPLTVAGGPTNDVGPNGLNVTLESKSSRDPVEPRSKGLNSRQLSVSSATLAQGQSVTVSVYLEAQGNENAAGFTLTFDPAVLSYAGAGLGADTSGAALEINANQVAAGRVAFALALPIGTSFSSGTKELVKVTLRASASAVGVYPVALSDQPVVRQVVDATATSLTTGYLNANLAINPPPILSIVRASETASLSWPAWANKFVLQQADGPLPSLTWSNVTATVTVSNNTATVTVPLSATEKFYRLQAQ
jgi:hypothetical protein